LQEINMTRMIETRIIDGKMKRRMPVALVAGAILAAVFAITAVPGSANANDRDRGEHRDWHHHGGWDRGYYGAPPVVYGTPYYAPPVVYGPGFGINLNIR
jgi:hypothetical protein